MAWFLAILNEEVVVVLQLEMLQPKVVVWLLVWTSLLSKVVVSEAMVLVLMFAPQRGVLMVLRQCPCLLVLRC